MSECSEKWEGGLCRGGRAQGSSLVGTAELGLERLEALDRLSQRQVWCVCRIHVVERTHVSGAHRPAH